MDELKLDHLPFAGLCADTALSRIIMRLLRDNGRPSSRGYACEILSACIEHLRNEFTATSVEDQTLIAIVDTVERPIREETDLWPLDSRDDLGRLSDFCRLYVGQPHDPVSPALLIGAWLREMLHLGKINAGRRVAQLSYALMYALDDRLPRDTSCVAALETHLNTVQCVLASELRELTNRKERIEGIAARLRN